MHVNAALYIYKTTFVVHLNSRRYDQQQACIHSSSVSGATVFVMRFLSLTFTELAGLTIFSRYIILYRSWAGMICDVLIRLINKVSYPYAFYPGENCMSGAFELCVWLTITTKTKMNKIIEVRKRRNISLFHKIKFSLGELEYNRLLPNITIIPKGMKLL